RRVPRPGVTGLQAVPAEAGQTAWVTEKIVCPQCSIDRGFPPGFRQANPGRERRGKRRSSVGEYRFITRWGVSAPRLVVRDTLNDSQRFPEWWPCYKRCQPLTPVRLRRFHYEEAPVRPGSALP